MRSLQSWRLNDARFLEWWNLRLEKHPRPALRKRDCAPSLRHGTEGKEACHESFNKTGVLERERERECVCVCCAERERERDRERDRERGRESESERERERGGAHYESH